jgi:hypothetical protein
MSFSLARFHVLTFYPAMKISDNWRRWLFWLFAGLWVVQLIWLAWYFAPEARDLAWRLARHKTGAAVRREDSFYRWLQSLARIMPPRATYVFLDDYQAGKEIEARYHLTPRRHILLWPDVPPSFLFYTLRQEQASWLIIREGDKPWESADAVKNSPAFRLLPDPGPGLVFRVNYRRLLGKFYD